MKKSFLVLFIAIALNGCYLLKSSQEFYGINTDGKQIVFVVDVSGSMEGKQEGSLVDQATSTAVNAGAGKVQSAIGGRVGSIVGSQIRKETTKLGAAKRELIPTIKGLPNDAFFTIVVFGDNVKAWKSSLVAANSTNKNLALVYLNALESNGGTPANQALEKSFTFRGIDTIFFLSDGQPTDSNAGTILSNVRAMNSAKSVKVNTVGLGGDQDEVFLSQLASENNGVYIKKD